MQTYNFRCSDAEISSQEKYPTFTRMEPPDTQVTNSVLALLKYYKWSKFSIIWQEDAQWETVAKHLNDQAVMLNFTVNHYLPFTPDAYYSSVSIYKSILGVFHTDTDTFNYSHVIFCPTP